MKPKFPGEPTADRVAEIEEWRFWDQVIDFIFGYDFFVSYSWKDARNYAVELAKSLKERGFECFLDSSDFEKGTNWRLGARRALRKTARLLLVCSPAALESQAVLDGYSRFGP